MVRHADKPLGAIALDTARAAIADAGLEVAQIDGFTTGAIFPTAGAHTIEDGVSIVSANWMAEHLGVNARWASGFQGFGQIPGSVQLAVNAVASGAADYVLLHRALHNPIGKYHGNPMREARGSMQWMAPQGYFGPLAMIALPYNEYLQRYGASRDEMAAVVVEARKNGARIPWSFWHDKPLTAEDYLAARVIADPICMYDCDIPVDGVATFVFTSAERARDLPNHPVLVSGFGMGTPTTRRIPQHWPLDDIMDTAFETTRRLWEHSGLGPDDVDLPQVYDGFSPFVWFWLEALGFCPVGEAHALRGRRRDRLRRARRPARAVGRRRARQRPDARRAPDARGLPAARGPGRRPPTGGRRGRGGVPQLAPLRRRRRLPPSLTEPGPQPLRASPFRDK